MKQGTSENRSIERYDAPSIKVIRLDMTQIICTSERQSKKLETDLLEGEDNW